MKVKLKDAPRTSRRDELVKASNLYAATKFPDRRPREREPKKAEILQSWEKRRDGFKIGNI